MSITLNNKQLLSHSNKWTNVLGIITIILCTVLARLMKGLGQAEESRFDRFA